MDHIAHKKGLDGELLPPDRSRAAAHRRGAEHVRARPRHAPQMTMRLNAQACSASSPRFVIDSAGVARAGAARDPEAGALGPRHPEGHVHSSSTTRRASTIARRPRRSRAPASRCPASRTTPGACGTTGSATSTRTSSSTARSSGKVRDKVVVVTGGIVGHRRGHRATSWPRPARKVMLVARDPEKARDPCMDDRRRRRQGWTYISCDLSDMADCDKLVATVLKEHGGCRFLVNNAGRSIRRGIATRLRPLPRLRAHDAAQLLRQPAPHHGLPAGDDRAEAAGTSSTSRSIGVLAQRAALLGLRRVEGGARRVQRRARPPSSSTRTSTSPPSTCRW